MKKKYIITFIVIALFSAVNLKAQIVFTGPTMTFTKAPSTDPLLVANQDIIVNSVRLTRGNTGGLFNIVNEPSNNNACGIDGWPTGTEWAYGTTANYTTLTYQPLGDLIGCGNFNSIVNNLDMVVHLIADDIYIDIKFTQWSSGIGGGFAYERSTSQFPAVLSTDVISACDSYTWIDGITYTSDNDTATFTTTTLAQNGADSIVTLDLTVNASTASTDVVSACGSYTWIDGVVYTMNNNTATHTLVNSLGCDSIVTLDLTINASTASTDVVSVCDSYTWIDGVVYTMNNNTATDTLVNSFGCDSIVTLDLTIGIIDLTTTTSNNTISANQTGESYQWIDCGNANALIAGETNIDYTATVSGDYAVIITTATCSDTSACVNIGTVGIQENLADITSIYPNPTNGVFTINLTNINKNTSVIVYDILGNIVVSKQLTLIKTSIDLTQNGKGIYFVNVQTGDELLVKKVILQ